MHGERRPGGRQPGQRHAGLQGSLAAAGPRYAGEVLVPDVRRVADDRFISSGGGQEEEVADLNPYLMPGRLDQRLGPPGAALVQLDALEAPLTGGGGRPGERVEAIPGGEQERGFSARRL